MRNFIEEFIEWWKAASKEERVEVLNQLGEDVYPVCETCWYVHP